MGERESKRISERRVNNEKKEEDTRKEEEGIDINKKKVGKNMMHWRKKTLYRTTLKAEKEGREEGG